MIDTPEEKATPAAPTDKEARIAALRERLRIERINGSSRDSGLGSTGPDFSVNSGNNDGPSGPDFQNAGRAVSIAGERRRRPQANNREYNHNGRGFKGSTLGSGPVDRRSSEDNSGATSEGSETGGRGVGRIITDEPIPARLNTTPDGEFFRAEPAPAAPKKRGRAANKSIKEQIADNPAVKAIRGQKQASLTLTDTEVEEYKESLPAALEDDFASLDKYLWGRQKLFTPDEADEEEVWSNMTEKEIATLTRLMIKGGKHNPAMATLTRGVVESNDYVQGITILGPRLKTTVRIMKETHRPAKKRGQRDNQA